MVELHTTVPLDMPQISYLVKLIAKKSLHSEYLLCILRKGCCVNIGIDLRRIFEKLDAREYTNMSQFSKRSCINVGKCSTVF